MKNIVFSLVALFPLLSYSQYEIPEPDPKSKKTEFRTSYFQANYITQKVLTRFLEEDASQISPTSKALHIEARDLYYPASGRYENNRDLRYGIKEKYLTPKSEKIRRLDSALNINKSWLNNIANDPVVDDFMSRLDYGWVFTVRNRVIYAALPAASCQRNCSVYKYEFDENYNLLANRLGKINGFRDTIYWLTTEFEYAEGIVINEVNKKCYDATCRKGLIQKTKTIVNGIPVREVEEHFSRMDNKLVKTLITDHYYNSNVLDSSVTNTYFFIKDKKEFYSKSSIKYSFDENNRLSRTVCREWDKMLKPLEVYTEEFEYLKNKYLYRYKESLNIELGKKLMPLQYEMTYTFL